MYTAYLVDLDGCLANDRHRVILAQGENPLKDYVPFGDGSFDWDVYFKYENVIADSVNAQLYFLLRKATEFGYSIVFLTGRPERTRKATEDWLNQLDIPYEHLLMRGDDDRQPAYDFKTKAIADFLDKHSYTFVIGFSDRDCDLKAYADHQIPGLLVEAYHFGDK